MLSKGQRDSVLRAIFCPNEPCRKRSAQKKQGATFCWRCLEKLPAHMRTIEMFEAAQRFLDVRFRSVRDFGGGKRYR